MSIEQDHPHKGTLHLTFKSSQGIILLLTSQKLGRLATEHMQARTRTSVSTLVPPDVTRTNQTSSGYEDQTESVTGTLVVVVRNHCTANLQYWMTSTNFLQ